MKKINPDKMSKTEFDRLGTAADKVTFHNSRPLKPHDRQALMRAARKGAGRPRIGAGAKRINITVEQDLLSHADAYARKNGLSRAAVVAEGLKRLLAA
jgi:hypothetical protein